MDPSTEWRRPHPLTLVVEIGSALRQVLLALAVVGFDLIEVGSLVELALVVGPMGGALARWYTTRYTVDDRALHLHHGLIWRRRQILPRANIQNVATTAGVVARMGSVVELHVSDASSNGDVKLRFVSRAEAERLTSVLRPATSPAGPVGPVGPVGPTGPVGAPGDPEMVAAGPVEPVPVDWPPLVTVGLGPLVRAELASWPFLVMAGLAALVAGGGSLLLWLGPDWPQSWGRRPWAVLGLALVFVAGAMAAQMASRLVAVGGYRLTAEPDRLRIQVGLLTEARITARRERIQQLKVERTVAHRMLGLERVLFETADVDIMNAAGTSYLHPAAPAGSWRGLAVEAFGHLDRDEPDLAPVSPLTRRRVLMRFVLTAPTALVLAWLHPALALVGAGAWLAGGWWYSRRRHQELGWALSPDQLLVRTGVVVGQLRLVDLDKVQSVRLAATFFQRRLALASFEVVTAGHGFAGRVRLPDLDAALAEDLLQRVAKRAATTPISDTL